MGSSRSRVWDWGHSGQGAAPVPAPLSQVAYKVLPQACNGSGIAEAHDMQRQSARQTSKYGTCPPGNPAANTLDDIHRASDTELRKQQHRKG